jgi:cytochrome c55X
MNRMILTGLAGVLLSSVLAAYAVPAGLDAKRKAELLYLLRQDCGSCHGMTLKGGLGSPLLPQTLAGKPHDLLVSAILDGRPNTAMPPWRGLLTANEASWLVDMLQKGLPDER